MNTFETFKPSKEEEMIRIADVMSFASRLDVKKFKQTMLQQGELINGIKNDLIRLIEVYKKQYEKHS